MSSEATGTNESTTGGMAAQVEAAATSATTEREIDGLPVPCACSKLRDGWSRRASSSYSPFYDGEGVWSRSEAATGTTTGEKDASDAPAGNDDLRGRSNVERYMPSPTVIADVLIEDLGFSLR